MSKPNKANKSNYVQAGRLTPDDFARERQKQRVVAGAGVPATRKTKRRNRVESRARAGAPSKAAAK